MMKLTIVTGVNNDLGEKISEIQKKMEEKANVILNNYINNLTSIKKLSAYKSYMSLEFIDFLNTNFETSVFIFGTGNAGKDTFELISDFNLKFGRNINIKAFLDNDKAKHNTYFCNILVLEPKLELLSDADHIIIASSWFYDIIKQLIIMGVKRERIIPIY